jgi:hypothetical protein
MRNAPPGVTRNPSPTMKSKSVEATHDQQAQQGAFPLAAGSTLHARKRRGFTCLHCGKWHGWYRHHKAHQITCQLRPAPVPRGPSRRKREMAEIKKTLDAMVLSGELYQTPDGRYGLAAWNESNK